MTTNVQVRYQRPIRQQSSPQTQEGCDGQRFGPTKDHLIFVRTTPMVNAESWLRSGKREKALSQEAVCQLGPGTGRLFCNSSIDTPKEAEASQGLTCVEIDRLPAIF